MNFVFLIQIICNFYLFLQLNVYQFFQFFEIHDIDNINIDDNEILKKNRKYETTNEFSYEKLLNENLIEDLNENFN